MSGQRKRVLLVGPVGSGKSTLCQAINEIGRSYKKTQAIEVVDGIVDTPGEYLENHRYYRALIITAYQVDCIFLLQDCTDGRMLYPPLFAKMFPGKDVLGIVSKVDLANNKEEIMRAEEKLRFAGVSRCFHICGQSGHGVQALHEYLQA